jgi:hypothetical protein
MINEAKERRRRKKVSRFLHIKREKIFVRVKEQESVTPPIPNKTRERVNDDGSDDSRRSRHEVRFGHARDAGTRSHR